MNFLEIYFNEELIHRLPRNEDCNLKKLVALVNNCKSLGWLHHFDITDEAVCLYVHQRYYADTAKLYWEYLLNQKEKLFMRILHFKVNGYMRYTCYQKEGIDPKKVEKLIQFCVKNNYLQYVEYLGDRNDIVDITLHNLEDVESARLFWGSIEEEKNS